jgi:group I intron endonuclease
MAPSILYHSGVYEIVNTVNGKRYVGSAANFANRFCVHRKFLREGNHHSKYLQRAWNKHGEPSFAFRILLICAKSNTIFFEQKAIDALNPEYNSARIAGSCLGLKHSAETRAKRSVLNLGNKFCVGRIPSDLCRARVAEANRMRKGFKRSPAAIAATAAAHRGMKRSAETRAKISEKAKARSRKAAA